MPQTRLLLTHRGGGYELARKSRTLPDGRQEDYWAADALEARFRDLYRSAGIKTSSHAGWRTSPIPTVITLHKGYDLVHIAALLGHKSVITTKRLVTQDPVRLADIVARTIYALDTSAALP